MKKEAVCSFQYNWHSNPILNMVLSDQFGLISDKPQWQSGGCHRYSLIYHGY